MFSLKFFHQESMQSNSAVFEYTTRFNYGKMKALIYSLISGIGRLSMEKLFLSQPTPPEPQSLLDIIRCKFKKLYKVLIGVFN